MVATRTAAVAACAAAVALAPTAARAATFTASCAGSTGDVASLIAAIDVANAVAGPDVVRLGAGCIYTVTAPHNNWYGPNALPPIASDVTIEGDGATILRGGGVTPVNFRFFYVGADRDAYTSPGPGRLTLRNVTLIRGRAQGGASDGGGGGAGLGGAIFNQGVLLIEGSTLVQNVAAGGAATGVASAGPGGGGMGTDSAGSMNTLTGGGFGVPPIGGFGGAAGGTSSGFQAGGAGGAGFRTSEPGGNAGPPPGSGGGPTTGLGGRGGLSSGTPGFSGDGSGGGGAGGFGQPGGSFGAGGGGTGGGAAEGGGGGGVGGGGGGAGGAGSFDAGHGGGGGFGGGGGAGGGTSGPSPGTGGNGGSGGFGGGGGAGGIGEGAAADGAGGAPGFGGGAGLAGAGGGGGGMGGAIFNMQGDVTIRASTLTGNAATGGLDDVPDNQIDPASGLGGAVFNLSGRVELVGSTLAGNIASARGSSIYNTVLDAATERAAVTTLRDSIVADESAPPDLVSAKFAAVPEGPPNLGSASAAVGDLNLVLSMAADEGGTITGSPLTVDPKLGSLGENGGPTQTLAPAPDSPVVDAGSAFGLGADQRGLARPSDFAVFPNAGDGSDIGAVELQAPQPLGPPPPANVGSAFIGSRVAARFRLRGTRTVVRRLRVRRLPANSKVVIACARKRGNCPFKRRARRYATARGLDRFEALFKRRRLVPRTRITIRVTAPGLVGLFVRYTTRAGKRPRRQELCLQPGARRPSRC